MNISIIMIFIKVSKKINMKMLDDIKKLVKYLDSWGLCRDEKIQSSHKWSKIIWRNFIQ